MCKSTTVYCSWFEYHMISEGLELKMQDDGS